MKGNKSIKEPDLQRSGSAPRHASRLRERESGTRSCSYGKPPPWLPAPTTSRDNSTMRSTRVGVAPTAQIYADELRQGLRHGWGMGTCAQPTPAWARAQLFDKQHAEKHFPLKRVSEAATGKGVLLNFADGEGKVWWFRYSYWNSSQSYILTKGWSRFVREKGLRAGDTIVFSHSTYGQEKQLFIDCRNTKTATTDVASMLAAAPAEKPKEAQRGNFQIAEGNFPHKT
ncbi:hypothetical protein SETIT_6G064600v2 [Setaria italica]|uniref:TF-B3 domain-containing protein n=1 Tax=Setaria italica TaxID=4555 RepID=A0A368RKE3_SETIT|nr:hypothetical protein SETIT_6G064600v2 [Setaria italica]